MKIVLLNDGKIGHFNQSKALVNTLEYEVINIKAKKSKSILRWIFKVRVFNSLNLLNLFYEVDKNIENIDLIISSGKDTEYLNIWLKKIFKSKNIYLGKPRGVNPKEFDYIFTSLDLKLPNQILLDVIPALDREIGTIFLDKNNNYYTLLFGGDSKNYKYDIDDIKALSTLLNKISKSQNIKWLITTSRRSKFESILKDLTTDIAYFVNYNQKAENVIGDFFANSSRVFVTEDSSSMIGESIASYKDTFSLYPKNFKLNGDFRDILDNLISKSFLKRVSIYDKNLSFLDFNFKKIEAFNKDRFSKLLR
jgi:hypothetical protein